MIKIDPTVIMHYTESLYRWPFDAPSDNERYLCSDICHHAKLRVSTVLKAKINVHDPESNVGFQSIQVWWSLALDRHTWTYKCRGLPLDGQMVIWMPPLFFINKGSCFSRQKERLMFFFWIPTSNLFINKGSRVDPL